MPYKFMVLVLAVFLTACGGSDGGSGGGGGSGPTDGDGSAKLTWLKPTENTDNSQLNDLEGFYIYFGNEDEYLANPTEFVAYSKRVDNFAMTSDGNMVCENLDSDTKMSCTISGLTDTSNWYFAVTAFNSLGVESGRSNIVCKQFDSTSCY